MKINETIAWYANRLRVMKPKEVFSRVHERWRQLTQTGFLNQLESFDPGPAAPKIPRLPDELTASVELRAQLAEDAKKLQGGRWQLFGWRVVDVGAPPCWHRDPACGVVIDPDIPAYRLNHRRLPDGADARSIWEINRWAEMTRLAMHGWLNHDLAAIRQAQLWLEDWCDRNPPGMGINWTSPLEVALRLINFTWFDALVSASLTADHQIIRDAQAVLVKRIVPVHTAWVWRYRSTGSSANNHLLGELSALTVAVSRWPKLEEIACSADAAWDWLGAEVLHQFAEDGGSHEQALHYHAFAFDLAWQAVRAVGCRAGDVYDRLVKAADFLQLLAHSQEPWDFGDNDDAQVVPVTQNRAQATAEWLAWLRGENNSLRFWLGVSPSLPPASSCRLFPKSGIAVVRTNDWMARLDASPLGFGVLAAHGHADALHVSVWDGDEALLIDPGTGGYYGFTALRSELAAWEAHNGPLPVGGYQTPKRLGPFLWTRHHAVPTLAMDGDEMKAQFEHEGCSFQRTVKVQETGVEICDVETSGKAFEVHHTFPPQCRLKSHVPGNDSMIRVSRGERSWVLQVREASVRVAIQERRVSPAYGKIETAPVLVLAGMQGSLSFTLQREV